MTQQEKLLKLLKAGPVTSEILKAERIKSPNVLCQLRKKGHIILTKLATNRQHCATYQLVKEHITSKGMKKTIKQSKYTCNIGDTVLFNNKQIIVAEVLSQGSIIRQERAFISGHRIDIDGTVLKRTTIIVEQNWKHL